MEDLSGRIGVPVLLDSATLPTPDAFEVTLMASDLSPENILGLVCRMYQLEWVDRGGWIRVAAVPPHDWIELEILDVSDLVGPSVTPMSEGSDTNGDTPRIARNTAAELADFIREGISRSFGSCRETSVSVQGDSLVVRHRPAARAAVRELLAAVRASRLGFEVEVAWMEVEPAVFVSSGWPSRTWWLLGSSRAGGPRDLGSMLAYHGQRSVSGGVSRSGPDGALALPTCTFGVVGETAFRRAVRSDEGSRELNMVLRGFSRQRLQTLVACEIQYADEDEMVIGSGGIGDPAPSVSMEGFHIEIQPALTPIVGEIDLEIRFDVHEGRHGPNRARPILLQRSVADGEWLVVGGLAPCGAAIAGDRRCWSPVARLSERSGTRAAYLMLRVLTIPIDEVLESDIRRARSRRP